ncbi:MAG: sugar ABC transporter ATP-binding protein, partial [Candidatus Latescibacteria bacterium]|nr:sugar ABC transporter ATP-binding protein [Candidatus Latescibacterota bacterium]
VGAGRTETLRTLFGLLPRKEGDIRLVTVPGIGSAPSPHRMINSGVSLLSEDRKNEGLALTRSIAENITFSTLPRLSRMGIVGDSAIEKAAERSSARLSIKLNRVTDKVESLSGGNQQKAALARLLEEDGDVFLLDEPTRGVDVGSKVEIFRLIGELAKQGKAVIIVSSYLPELLGVCDTIAVMYRGVLGKKRPVGEWDEYTIMNEATSGIENIA